MSALQTVLATALETKWAMLPKTLDAIISIIQRDNRSEFADFHIIHKDAYVGDLGQPVKDTKLATVNGNTGIITISGPMLPRAGMYQSVSSPEMASYERISKEFQALESDPKIKNILFVLDTPGGAVSGVSDLAKMIQTSKKNTQGYVMGMAASAGYWLGSSLKQLYSSNTGEVGSIGVVAAMQDTREADAKNGIHTIEIVSSVSPNKRLDPATDEGKNAIQAIVDQLGEIFVETVAANRKCSAEDVISKFGAGGMMVASSALKVGMIDGIMTLQELINRNNNPSATVQQQSTYMSEGKMAEQLPATAQTPDNKTMTAEEFKQCNPSAYSAILLIGAENERNRIKGIEAISHPAAQKLVQEAKYDGNATKESVALKFAEQMSQVTNAQADAPNAVAQAARDLAASTAAIPQGSSAAPAVDAKAEQVAGIAAAMTEGINANSKNR